MAQHGYPLAGVRVDQRFQCLHNSPSELFRRLVVHGPLTAHHRLPARVVGGLELLDGHVLAGVAIPLGQAVDHVDVETLRRRQWLRGLNRTPQRAGVDSVDRLAGEIFGEVAGLRMTRIGELRISDTLGEFAPYW